MEEQKLKRIIAASVSTAVMLLVIFLVIMVYQMILLSKGRNEVNDLNEEIARLERLKSDTENQIEIWQTDWKIDERARELGYLYDYTK